MHEISAAVAALCFLAASARADERTYGTLASHSAGSIEVRTKNSVGHWKLDASSKVEGALVPFAWVFVEVETNGHVKTLKVEEAPTSHTGVIKQVVRNALIVRSGNAEDHWNLPPTAVYTDADRGSLRTGDEIAVRLYKNHNVAELKRLKSGVQIR